METSGSHVLSTCGDGEFSKKSRFVTLHLVRNRFQKLFGSFTRALNIKVLKQSIVAVSLFLSLSITATYFYVDSLYGYGIDGDNNNVVYLDVSARAYTFFITMG